MTGLSPIESWLYMLKNMGTFAGKPEELGERYKEVAEASKIHDLPDKEKLKYLSDMISEEEMLDMREATLEEGIEKGREEMRELMKQEMLDMREATLEEGREEARELMRQEMLDMREATLEEGREEERFNIARKLLNMKLSPEDVADVTNLPLKDIEALI